MRLMRVGAVGEEQPVVSEDGQTWYDASAYGDFDPTFFGADGLERLRADLGARRLQQRDIAGQRIGAPIATPQAIICIGQNYAAHAAESGSAPPQHPIVFLKHPNTLRGPHDDVRVPRGAQSVDWEVELAVVIGREDSYLDSDEAALACVAGYALANDVSERDFQRKISGGQWSKGKCCPDFFPLGPWLAVDEIADPQDLHLRSTVNGETRQDSSTADMIFSVATLIRDLSQVMTLSPGDVVSTGTPQGVAMSGKYPYLQAGDVMEMFIDGLGQQRCELIAPDVP